MKPFKNLNICCHKLIGILSSNYRMPMQCSIQPNLGNFLWALYSISWTKIQGILNIPWITKGLQISFWKKINKTCEERTYKTLFETLKKRSKKFYDSNLISKYKHNIKRTWDVMKQILENLNSKLRNFHIGL